MTLCVAWVRRTVEPAELVFATDSRLNAPGRWDVGVKLFELPRQGALIAFHGTASFAHTLIQHAENDFLERPEFQSCQSDLHDLVEPLCEHFSGLFAQFRDLSPVFLESIEQDKADTGFLLGGWSWRQQDHALWRLDYQVASRRFIPTPVPAIAGNMAAFVGDGAAEAEAELRPEMEAGTLDMQPMRILHSRTYPEDLVTTVGGPLQAAKVYASGRVEFFAVAWPNGESEVYRRAARFTQQGLRQPVFLDAATGQELDVLPERLPIDENYDWGPEEDFIRRCYPAPVFSLRTDLRDHEKQRLVGALKAVGFDRLAKSFSPGHTVASKLLNSQVGRLWEIASRFEDKEVRRQIQEFLNEPYSEEGEEGDDEAAGAGQTGGPDE
jgi:hypothetical protein